MRDRRELSEDDQAALALLRQELADTQAQIKSFEEERRLFDRLGYSPYYLDVQLRALRNDLALCQYRIRLIERPPSRFRVRRRAPVVDDESTPEPSSPGYLIPVLGAFVVSVLAVAAAGLLWWERIGQDTALVPSPTVPAMAAPTVTPTIGPSPTLVRLAHAVVVTDGLNVRAEAGTQAPVLRVLKVGEIVLLADDEEDADGLHWFRLEDGGWIAAEHVQIYRTRQEAEEAARQLLP